LKTIKREKERSEGGRKAWLFPLKMLKFLVWSSNYSYYPFYSIILAKISQKYYMSPTNDTQTVIFSSQSSLLRVV
jgi:hypothetical protein